MTFQAYLDTIRQKTGLGPKEFVSLAASRGFGADTKAGEIVAWLAEDYGLGRGHAMAIVSVLKQASQGGPTPKADRIDSLFSGSKAQWRPLATEIIEKAEQWGGIALAPTSTYLSLLKDGAKFAILAPRADGMDVGIKLKEASPTERFETAGKWNAMVTHRVRMTSHKDLDKELLGWLKRAYEAA